jgi:WD40 repeat protein
MTACCLIHYDREDPAWNSCFLPSSVMAVAFSPDSKLLASASDDETVKLRDTGSGSAKFWCQQSSGASPFLALLDFWYPHGSGVSKILVSAWL